MAQALPDHEVARERAHPRVLAHRIGDDGKPWVNLFYDFGGVGGRHGVDGPDATGVLLPRRSVGDPPDRAARGAVPVRRALALACVPDPVAPGSGAAASAPSW